jgi:hypothetical protein
MHLTGLSMHARRFDRIAQRDHMVHLSLSAAWLQIMTDLSHLHAGGPFRPEFAAPGALYMQPQPAGGSASGGDNFWSTKHGASGNSNASGGYVSCGNGITVGYGSCG